MKMLYKYLIYKKLLDMKMDAQCPQYKYDWKQ